MISSTWWNNTGPDIASNGLSNCVTKDGQSTTTAVIPFAAGIYLTGTASNIRLGSNFISNGGTDAGMSLDASNNATFSGSLATSQTAGIIGTTTNNAANAGSVGEYVTSAVASGAGPTLSNNTPADVTTISLTAGDWDVSVVGMFNVDATVTVANVTICASLTTATLDTTPGRIAYNAPFTSGAGGNTLGFSVPSARFSLSGTATIYMVAQMGLNTGTNKAFGIIHARRVR